MRLIDITGQVFGVLRVLEKVPASCKWECECACGKKGLYTGTALRSGKSKNCNDCRLRRLAAGRPVAEIDLWRADMTLYQQKVGYRVNRKPRGLLGSNRFKPRLRGTNDPQVAPHPSLQWSLTLEEYIRLITSACFYCGQEPHQDPQGAWMKGKGLKRNGIDRVDNGQGYNPGNCVSACTACNRAKCARSQAEFIESTRRRYEHLKAGGLFDVEDHAAE